MTDHLQSVKCLRIPFSKTARTSLSDVTDTFSLPSLMNLALRLVAYFQPGCAGLTVDLVICTTFSILVHAMKAYAGVPVEHH
jgi:hypothetical protein